jgi:hypothetical protein
MVFKNPGVNPMIEMLNCFLAGKDFPVTCEGAGGALPRMREKVGSLVSGV